MGTLDVAVLVGSLRKGSFNRKMALALAELAKPKLALEIVEIGDLSLYDDLEGQLGLRQLRQGQRHLPVERALAEAPDQHRDVQGSHRAPPTLGAPRDNVAERGDPCVSPGILRGNVTEGTA